MSPHNVAVVKALWDAFGELIEAAPGDAPLERQIDTPDHAGAVESMLAHFDPDVEWDLTHFADWPEDNMYRGHDGIRRFWRAYLSAWSNIKWEIEEFIDAGDEVVVLLNQQAVGRGSGAVTDYPPYAQIWSFGDGKVVRFAVYTDRAEALRAAGVRVA